MPDTLKTAITLPGELETLTTADSSPMHIIGHATITLQLKMSDPSFHRSQIIDDRRHIRYRLPEITGSLMIGMKENYVTFDTMGNFSVVRKIWSQV